jgi:DNA-directed RNA polymerase specialized sigma24 family protein
MTDSADITQWLDAARGGNREALDRVLGTLYEEVHALARRQLAGQQEQTLDASALVREGYLKLIGSHGAEFGDRAHFFA